MAHLANLMTKTARSFTGSGVEPEYTCDVCGKPTDGASWCAECRDRIVALGQLGYDVETAERMVKAALVIMPAAGTCPACGGDFTDDDGDYHLCPAEAEHDEREFARHDLFE